MTLLSILVSLGVAFVIAVTVASIAIGIRWMRQLSPAERVHWRGDWQETRQLVLALLVLALLPLALVALAQFQIVAAPSLLVGGFLWAVLAWWFWEHHALKVSPALWRDGKQPPEPPIPGLELVKKFKPKPLQVLTESDLTHKTFSWTFATQPFPPYQVPQRQTIELDISKQRYDERRAEPRLPHGQWSGYAAANLPEHNNLALQFLNLHAPRGWSTFEQASNVLSFVQQCITYASDLASTGQGEYPRYAIETLMDEVGDCEDDSILGAAVLARLGFRVALLHYPTHCALGIAGAEGLPGEFVNDPARGARYFYAETTSTGWQIGEVPSKYRGVHPELIEPVEFLVQGPPPAVKGVDLQ